MALPKLLLMAQPLKHPSPTLWCKVNTEYVKLADYDMNSSDLDSLKNVHKCHFRQQNGVINLTDFFDISISQGSAATCFRQGKILNDFCIANCSGRVHVKNLENQPISVQVILRILKALFPDRVYKLRLISQIIKLYTSR